MPLYEYRCDDCGLVFEVRQKFSDEPLNTCRHCGGEIKKLISQTAFALKGGGWYQQGYSAEKKAAESTAASGTDSTSSSSSSSNKETCASCPKAANG